MFIKRSNVYFTTIKRYKTISNTQRRHQLGIDAVALQVNTMVTRFYNLVIMRKGEANASGPSQGSTSPTTGIISTALICQSWA
jgi:hypothetical protein